MSRTALRPLAIRACKRLKPDASDEVVRDVCDAVSGGDLDCMRLDILVDMTTQRLRFGPRQYTGRL